MIKQTFMRDGNAVPIQNLGLIALKNIDFSVGTWAAGTFPLFKVTGPVAVNIFALCQQDLAGTGTVEVGVSGATATLMTQKTIGDIDAKEVWQKTAMVIGGEIISGWQIIDQDIALTIGGTSATGGVLDFYCLWAPLSRTANVIPL